jgi:hypothetical protein
MGEEHRPDRPATGPVGDRLDVLASYQGDRLEYKTAASRCDISMSFETFGPLATTPL